MTTSVKVRVTYKMTSVFDMKVIYCSRFYVNYYCNAGILTMLT